MEEALDTVGHEERELALTRATKVAAVEAFQQDSRALARTLEWIMVLAGRRDLSEEVRPARLTRRARAADDESPPDAEPSDGETPDEETPEDTGSPNPPGPPATAGNSGTTPP